MGEWNKLVRNKKMLCRLILVLLGSILAQVFLMFFSQQPSVDKTEVRQYMAKLTGELTEEKAAFLMAENEAIIRSENGLALLAQDYLEGKVTKAEYAREEERYRSLVDRRGAFYEVWDKYSFVQQDPERRYFLMEDGPLFFPALDPFFLLLIVMLVNCYICEESDSGMVDMIRTAKEGHVRSARTKILIILGMSVFYMLFKQGCKALLFVFANGREALNYPLQSLYLASTSSLQWSIGKGLYYETLYKVVGAMGLASVYMILGHQIKQKEILANVAVMQLIVYVTTQSSITFRRLPLPGNLVRGSQYLVGDISDRMLWMVIDYAWIGKDALVITLSVSLVLVVLAYINFRHRYRNFKTKMVLGVFLVILALTGCGKEVSCNVDLENQTMTQNDAFYFVENGGTIYEINKKQGKIEKLPLSIFLEQNDYLVEALLCQDDKLYVSVYYDWGDDISSNTHFDVLEINLNTGKTRTKWQLKLFKERMLLGAINRYHSDEMDVVSMFIDHDNLYVYTGEKLKCISKSAEKTLSRQIYGNPSYVKGEKLYIQGKDWRIYAFNLRTKETSLAYAYPVDTFTLAGDQLVVSTREGLGIVRSIEEVQCIAPERSEKLSFDGKKLYSLEQASRQVVCMDLDGGNKEMVGDHMDLWITSWDSPYVVTKFFNISSGVWEMEIREK